MPEELIQTQIVGTHEAVLKPEEINVSPEVSPEIQAEIARLEARRIDLEKTAREAEEKAIYWRKQKAEARAEYFKGDRREEKPPTPPEVVPEVGTAPKKEDFDDYDKYVEALADHRANVIVAKWQKDEEAKKGQTEYQKKIGDLYVKLDKGYEKYPDFEEVARDPSVPITAIIRDALVDSEIPADVAYYLGKNRGEAIRLSRMTPNQVNREIMRIEMEIKNNPNPQPKITQAPPPINPVGSSEIVSGKKVEEMTQKEYEAWRKSQGARLY